MRKGGKFITLFATGTKNLKEYTRRLGRIHLNNKEDIEKFEKYKCLYPSQLSSCDLPTEDIWNLEIVKELEEKGDKQYQEQIKEWKKKS